MFLKKTMSGIKIFFILMLAAHFLSNCKSVAENSENTEVKGIITASKKAFSPNKDGILDQQVFKLKVESLLSNPVTSWILDIKDLNNITVFNQQGKYIMPIEIIWNGKNNNNMIISDGEYRAYLLVNYKNGTSSIGKTESFFIDIIPPNIQVKADKDYFTPDNDGNDDIMYYNFSSAQDLSGIKKWKMAIYNPDDNKEFSSVSGEGTPAGSYYWNGKSENGQIILESTTEYPMILFAEDNAGNKSVNDLLPVTTGILVELIENGRYKIKINNISFMPDTTVMNIDKKNTKILDILADSFQKFPDYKIIVEGYSSRWTKGLNEQTGYDLSVGRAEIIVDELIKRGVKPASLLVKGKGFEDPIVALQINMTIEDKETMKINRRVEFYKQ